MAKKVIFLMLSLVLSARFALPVQAADWVAISQNVQHSAVPFNPVQNHSTSLSFEAVDAKINDVFKPKKEKAKLQFTYSGSCGTNVNWYLDTGTGKLTISGSGATYNYVGLETPWRSYKDSIKSLIVESGITEIGDGTFQYLTNLKQVSIPYTVTSICGHAFVGCSSLTSITIPSAVTFIGGGAFHGCHKLSSFTVPVGNQNYCSIDGVLCSKDGKTLVQYPYAKSNYLFHPC